jgi:hypothetical protein
MRGLLRTARQLFARCVDISTAEGFRRIEAANLHMLAFLWELELRFDTALQQNRHACRLAEQIGHARAAILAHQGLADVYTEMGQLESARESCAASLVIARSLGARRFIAYSLMIQVQIELAAGQAQATTTLREAIEIAREVPAFVLPYGWGLAAMAAQDAQERAAALAEGERLLAAGAVSHNFILFNRYAIEACLAAEDWGGVERYAAALERSMAEEPLPLTDFLVARARAIAAAGRGERNETQLRALLSDANRIGWKAVTPALEATLALH